MKPKTSLSQVLSILIALSKAQSVKEKEIAWLRSEFLRWIKFN